MHIYDWLRFRLGGLATERGWRKAPAHLQDAGAARCPHPWNSTAIYVRNQLAMAQAWPRRAAPASCWRSTQRSTAPTIAHPTADIAYATDLGKRLYPGQAEVSRQTRPALAEAVASLRSQGVDAVNLSDLLRDKTVDVFVETAHFNATGHEMIAAAIAREILHGAAPYVRQSTAMPRRRATRLAVFSRCAVIAWTARRAASSTAGGAVSGVPLSKGGSGAYCI